MQNEAEPQREKGRHVEIKFAINFDKYAILNIAQNSIYTIFAYNKLFRNILARIKFDYVYTAIYSTNFDSIFNSYLAVALPSAAA
jgi:hypothetical protein